MEPRRLITPFALAVSLAGMVPSNTIADTGLDALRAFTQRVQAIQEKMAKGAGSAQAGPANATEQGSLALASPSSGTDEAVMKTARKTMDIVGVRIGMPLGEALNAIRRSNPKLQVIQRWGERYADADNKDHIWLVFLATGERPRASEQIYLTVSLPPESRVVNVQRVRTYQKNDAPTMASTFAALQEKYGDQIVHKEPVSDGERWIWQVGGRFEKNRPCEGGALTLHGVGWSYEGDTRTLQDATRCGVVLSAQVRSRQDNPALVEEIRIGTTDYIMAYHDWESSNRYLLSISKTRDKAEIEDANKRGGPRL